MKINTTVDWDTHPAILVNPLKKKKLERLLILLMVAISLCVGLYLWMDKSINNAIVLYKNEMIKTEMTTKANEGKVSAVLWMAEHYPDEQTIDKLDNLIGQGNAEAMLVKAQLVYPTDKILSTTLINQAAQEGLPTAVAFLSDKKTVSDVSFMDFFTQYVFKGD